MACFAALTGSWMRTRVLALLLLGGIAAAAMLPTAARAGSWVEVSCVNPNQSASPSEGWSSFYTGGVNYGSNNGTGCAPGSPMFGLLSTDAGVPVGYGENLEYLASGGINTCRGTVDAGMYADGYGYGASGTAVAYTPNSNIAPRVFFQCAAGLTPCYNGTNDY